MNPKDGSAGSPDTPETPAEPLEAPEASATAAASYEANPSSGSPNSTEPTKISSAQSESATETQEEDGKLHYVAIELQDKEGNPVPGEAYEVKLPDGSTRRGRLDDEGKARIDDIPGGKCEITFTRIHGEEWDPK